MSQQPLLLTLTIQTGSQAGQTFIIQDGINVIGSDPNSADILLLDETVSPNHARIVMQSEGTWIQDLDSTSGTFVNGQPVTTSIWLQPGNTIQIGPTVRLSVSSQPISSRGSAVGDTLSPPPSIPLDETLVSQAPATAKPRANLAPFHLVVQYGPQPGQLFQLVYGSQTVGRGPNNQIVIQEPAISRQHAQITVQPEGVWIQDLGSSNGTFVNGQRLASSVWLQPGDQIRLGTSVTVGLETSRPVPAPSAPPSRGSILTGIMVIMIVLLVLAGAAIIAVRWIFQPDIVVASPFLGPTIRVHQPTPNAKAAFNAPLPVYASVRDEQGVRRAELWANGAIVAAKDSVSEEGNNPFSFVPVPSWAPLTTGEHLLSIRAYSSDGRINDSHIIEVNALLVSSEGASLPYIAQEGDTLEIVAEKFERSVEEIKVLNPQFEEVASAEGLSPTEITIPAGVAIAVPTNVNPDQLHPPDRPVVHATPSGGGSFSGNRPAILNSCSLALSHQEQNWQLRDIEFRPELPDLSPENTTCYLTIGTRGHTIVRRPANMTVASIDFPWPQPVEPVHLQFTCLTNSQPPDPPPMVLGVAENEVSSEQWLNGERIEVSSDNGSFTVAYRLALADGSSPSSSAGLVTEPLPPPRLSRLEDSFPGCFPILCPGPNCSRCSQILTWTWQPNPGHSNQSVCFETHERIKRAEAVLSQRIIQQFPVDITPFGDNGLLGAVEVPDLQPERLDCDTRAEYFLRVLDASGNFADSEPPPLPGPEAPDCMRTATVTFETLRILKAPGSGWEAYSASFYANSEPPLPLERPWQGTPGLPHVGNTYFIGDPDLLNGNNSLTVPLGEQDDLTISATFSKFIDGFWELSWCQPELYLNHLRIPTELPGGQETHWTLTDPAGGACEVEISITMS